MLLDGLDEVGHFLDKWIHRLVRHLAALAGDGASRTGAKDVFPDDGTVLAVEFQPIPTLKHGRHGAFGQQAARIVEDQGGDLIIGTLIDRTGQPSADTRWLAKIPAPDIDQVRADSAQRPVAGLLAVRPPALRVLVLRDQQGAGIAHGPDGLRLEQRFDVLQTSVEPVVVAHREGYPAGPNRGRHALTASIRRGHRFFTQHVLPSLHRGNHLGLVHRIRGGDNHRIHLRALQQGIEIVIDLWNAMLLGKGSTAGFITTQDRHQARRIDCVHGRHEGMLGNTARAQQRNTKRHSFFLPQGWQ